MVPAVTVNYGDPDINTTGTYTAGQQVATIVYVDRTTGQTLNTLVEHGASDTTIPYQSANDLKTYEGQGYVLDDNQYDPTTTPKFDDDSNVDQTYYIYLKHGTKNVSETPTVHETIHYMRMVLPLLRTSLLRSNLVGRGRRIWLLSRSPGSQLLANSSPVSSHRRSLATLQIN